MTTVIGIAGGTASGKTSILHFLEEQLGEDVQVLAMDAYYHSYKEYDLAMRKTFNYDHPRPFDIQRLVEDLKALREGQPIEMPVYDYVNYTRSEQTRPIRPHPIILVEGLFVLYFPQLLPLLDLKVYVQADPDVRLIRRIRRDQIERGRSLESILNQYMETIKPMHEAFIAPTKKQADIIIPQGIENQRGVSILLEHVLHRIAQSK